MSSSIVVFATDPYESFKDDFCKSSGLRAGKLTRVRFLDGERYLRVEEHLQGRDAVIIGGTINDEATLELYDLACGVVALGVNKLSLVIPYFGYSTQERALKPGEVVTAKSRAVLLSSIPHARLASEVLLVDLHTDGIAHYFEGHMHSVHLSARAVALDVVRELMTKGPTVVGCTDAGRAKWVQGLANAAGIRAAFVYKMRTDDNKTVVTGVNADVKGHHVVIYDDMVRSGGSLLEAARAYHQAGATGLTAIATHGVLPAESLQKIYDSKLFQRFVCTDTHPRAVELAKSFAGFLEVRSVAGILRDYFASEINSQI